MLFSTYFCVLVATFNHRRTVSAYDRCSMSELPLPCLATVPNKVVDASLPPSLMPNQHKPLRECPVVYQGHHAHSLSAPEDSIRDILTFYFNLGLNDSQIAENCRDHFDTSIHSMRCSFTQECFHSCCCIHRSLAYLQLNAYVGDGDS